MKMLLCNEDLSTHISWLKKILERRAKLRMTIADAKKNVISNITGANPSNRRPQDGVTTLEKLQQLEKVPDRN